MRGAGLGLQGASARVKVMLPLPFDAPFDYRLPQGAEIPQGTFVEVPFGRRSVIGVAWEGEANLDLPEAKVKPVERAFSAIPPMPPALRRMIDWTSAYTMSDPGAVLRMAMSVPSVFETAERPRANGWRLADDPPARARITPERRRVLDAMEAGRPYSSNQLCDAADVSIGVLKGLSDAGLIVPALMPHEPIFGRPNPDYPGPPLSDAQAEVAGHLRAKVAARTYSTTLLTGVTGSGKTEVYLDAIAECLRAGRQALVLLPEIALSSQWLERFERRFGVSPAIWHSELSDKRRRETWLAVARGEAPVLVGARSALFLPFPDVGLVVVDEEHEGAFKQEEGVVYHARDMAIVRAKLGNAAALLVTATPSLETDTHARSGRYAHYHLDRRHGIAVMPDVMTLDLRMNPPARGRFLSPLLCEAVEETMGRGEQAMLFLNRRGYAPMTLCRTCGYRYRCPQCSAWLVEHRAKRILQCHHCGHLEKSPDACRECHKAETLVPIGPGVERIHEEALERWPGARILIMASDTLGGPSAVDEAAKAIVARQVDLIIGTQIVAKGWTFPHLTLVGVVDADLGLGGGDLRAGERTVQMLHQVAGRAGRAELPGRVMLQTFSPEHPVMQALVANDIDAFMREEAANRRPSYWPPFGRLAALIVSSEDAREAERVAWSLGQSAPGGGGVDVLGPAPAPLALLRGRHRHRLLLKARKDVAVQPIVRDWLRRAQIPSTTRVQVDIDPISFM